MCKKLRVKQPGTQLVLNDFVIPSFHQCSLFRDADVLEFRRVKLEPKPKKIKPKKKKEKKKERSPSPSPEPQPKQRLRKSLDIQKPKTDQTERKKRNRSSVPIDRQSPIDLYAPIPHNTHQIASTGPNSIIFCYPSDEESDGINQSGSDVRPVDPIQPLSPPSRSPAVLEIESHGECRKMPRSRKEKDSFYQSLPSAPTDNLQNGDHIAFRLLELGRAWTPHLSFWKEALVVDVDSVENLITLEKSPRIPGVQSLNFAEGTSTISLEMTSLKDIRWVARRVVIN